MATYGCIVLLMLLLTSCPSVDVIAAVRQASCWDPSYIQLRLIPATCLLTFEFIAVAMTFALQCWLQVNSSQLQQESSLLPSGYMLIHAISVPGSQVQMHQLLDAQTGTYPMSLLWTELLFTVT